MKKLMLMLVVVFAVAGCGIPEGVKASLYTAKTGLNLTVEEATSEAPTAGTVWHIPADATMEQKLTIRERQVVLLVNTMAQANRNLEAVVDWFRTGKEPD